MKFDKNEDGGWIIPHGTSIPDNTEIPAHSELGSFCKLGAGCRLGEHTRWMGVEVLKRVTISDMEGLVGQVHIVLGTCGTIRVQTEQSQTTVADFCARAKGANKVAVAVAVKAMALALRTSSQN